MRVSQLEPRRRLPVEEGAIRTLVWTERVILFAIGVLLFVGALALLVHVATDVGPIFTSDDVIGQTTVFLDLILLTLMLVELAYTVMLSLRGAMLAAEPFLIVGLIAVIRRILVITVGVILAFVISIVLLRLRRAPVKNDAA